VPRPALASFDDDPTFRDARTGLVALDTHLVIRSVNRAFLQAVDGIRDELLGRHVFDAYPGDPDAPDGNPQPAFARSFERVLSTGRANHLVVRRYDVPDRRLPGRFVERHWVPVHEPIRGGGGVAGVLCRIERVPAPRGRALVLLERCRALVDGGGDAALLGLAEAVVDGLRALGQLEREATQLKEALTSRATIDQAKGIVMTREAVDPETAFARLVTMSNESNVRLVDVASALVYQVQRGATGSRE
jgi:hypothetical protein